MLKDEYKVYEEKMRKSIDSVAADFAAVRARRANAAAAEAVSRLTSLPVFMTCCAEALYPELAGTIDRLFPLKLQKLYYQLTQEVSYGKTNISGRAL